MPISQLTLPSIAMKTLPRARRREGIFSEGNPGFQDDRYGKEGMRMPTRNDDEERKAGVAI